MKSQQIDEMLQMANEFQEMRQAKILAEREVDETKAQLNDCLTESTKQQHELQNSLQSTRQLLEEVKLEYEEFSERMTLEAEVHRHSSKKRYAALVEEYENYKLRGMEVTQGLLREQQEIVRALQAQFKEYRSTAESMFYDEAVKLEQRLISQSMKHEQQIAAILKRKDREYAMMLTAKDAKIMNLIEGTDLQRILVKHDIEVEQMRKQHEKNVKMAVELAQSDQRRQIEEMKMRLSDQETAIEKATTAVEDWKKKLVDNESRLRRQKEESMEQERMHLHTIDQMKQQLQQAHTEMEELHQNRERLRHKILRLRLQVDGEADDTVESRLKRLSRETDKMAQELTSVSEKYREQLRKNQMITHKLDRASANMKYMEDLFTKRAHEYVALSKGLEKVMYGKLDTLCTRLGQGRTSPNTARRVAESGRRQPSRGSAAGTRKGQPADSPVGNSNNNNSSTGTGGSNKVSPLGGLERERELHIRNMIRKLRQLHDDSAMHEVALLADTTNSADFSEIVRDVESGYDALTRFKQMTKQSGRSWLHTQRKAHEKAAALKERNAAKERHTVKVRADAAHRQAESSVLASPRIYQEMGEDGFGGSTSVIDREGSSMRSSTVYFPAALPFKEPEVESPQDEKQEEKQTDSGVKARNVTFPTSSSSSQLSDRGGSGKTPRRRSLKQRESTDEFLRKAPGRVTLLNTRKKHRETEWEKRALKQAQALEQQKRLDDMVRSSKLRVNKMGP